MTPPGIAADPGLGQATLPADSLADLLRRNATDAATADAPAIRFGHRLWTHREYFEESCRWANLFLSHRDPGRPLHVAVLLDNCPEYLFAFGGAALAGGVVVGINHTRGGEQLLHDVDHTDCVLLVHSPAHADLSATVIDRVPASLALGDELTHALEQFDTTDPHREAALEAPWALIFTSGTSSSPKAVICSQRRILTTGTRMAALMGLSPEDTGYISMPLFHSSSMMVGWASSVVAGASVGLAPKFSVSNWLPDVRHYGATYFNYTGKPLSYLLTQPERDDDGDNTLRIAYGNEGAPAVVEEFSRRFGVEIIDGFGATEGGLAVTRSDDAPAGAVGLAGPELRIVDDDGVEKVRATFDHHGVLIDPEGCVGEIVNVSGVGVFEGYYNNDEANARATRNGWYWSGDLGYIDQDGFLFFAGRTADWIRVDGENFSSGPIETIIGRYPEAAMSSVYGVPDAEAGDQVMCALVMRHGSSFDPEAFAAWLDAQPDLAAKWKPTYVRVTPALPMSPTNKVLAKVLIKEKYRLDRVSDDAIWVRRRGEAMFAPFTDVACDALRDSFRASGRERFWEA